MIAVWAALGVAVAGIVGGLVVAAVRALRAWRVLKATKRTVVERLDAIASSADEIEAHLARASEGSERLAQALATLKRSRARLDVQLGALREARAAAARVLPFLGSR